MEIISVIEKNKIVSTGCHGPSTANRQNMLQNLATIAHCTELHASCCLLT